jgi:hypothetical protein
MEPVQESRERERLYIPTRAAVRPSRPVQVSRTGIPAGPWASDHPWRPEGQEPDYTPEVSNQVPVRVAILAAVVALNFLFPWASPRQEILILLVDIVGVVVALDSLNKLWYGYRNRKPRMRWTRFPAFTGGRLEGILVARPSPEVIGPILAVLRCVQDERVTPAEGEVFPRMIYHQFTEFPVPGDRLKEVAVAFDIPADLPGTDLGREDAIYWQVAVRIPVVGPDEELAYLAPVYSRPGA